MSRIAAGLAAVVTVGAVLVLTPHPALAASGSFTVLSYNVAGLPEGLSSAPTPRDTSTTAIGQRLGPYDIVHVQEDFNYHANLYAADTHWAVALRNPRFPTWPPPFRRPTRTRTGRRPAEGPGSAAGSTRCRTTPTTPTTSSGCTGTRARSTPATA